MAYIGNSPANIGNYQIVDDISSTFNGTLTSFALTASSLAINPAKSGQLLVSINGVLQEPDDTGTEGFKVSGSNIVFSSAPATSSTFWAVWQGQAVDIGTPSDGVVGTAQMSSAELALTGGLSLGDNVKAKFGAGDDLQIYHSGNHSYIADAGTGLFQLRTNGSRIEMVGQSGSEYMARFEQDGAVKLYYDNSQKLSTTSTGIDVTGSVTCDGFTSTGIDDNATSTAITIDASKNVGIGVTPESWGTYQTALQVGPSGTIANYSSGSNTQTHLTCNAYALTSPKYLVNSAAASMRMTNGAYDFRVAPSGTAGSAITWTTPLTISTAGDVTVGTGNLVIGTSGKGIDFSATSDGSGTMTSEVLDDYEEGTWTPVMKDTSDRALSTNTGSSGAIYVKIGRQVTVTGRITTDSVGSASGQLILTGLPFAAYGSSLGGYSGGTVGRAGNLNIASGTNISLAVSYGQTYCEMTRWDNSVGTTDMQVSEWSADGWIMFCLVYQTS